MTSAVCNLSISVCRFVVLEKLEKNEMKVLAGFGTYYAVILSHFWMDFKSKESYHIMERRLLNHMHALIFYLSFL